VDAVSRTRLTTAERLRELAWDYTLEEIAEAACCPLGVIEALYDTGRGHGHRRTCDAMERAWAKLASPDVDEVAVARVLDGDYPARLLTPPERVEAVRYLVLSRRSNREIAEQLQVTSRTVQRTVTDLGLNGYRPTGDPVSGATW